LYSKVLIEDLLILFQLIYKLIYRLYSKLIPANHEEGKINIRRSYENYLFVVNYVDKNEGAEEIVEKEIQICRDFVQLLPSSPNFH